MRISRSLALLFKVMKPYRFAIVLGIAISLLPSYFSIWTPYLVGDLIDRVFISRELELFWFFLGIFIFCRLALFLSQVAASYCLSRLGIEVLTDFRNNLLSKILRYPFSFFDRQSSGTLTTRLTNDIQSLNEFFSSGMVGLMGNALLIPGGAVIMLLIHWKLAFVALLVIPLFVWVTAVADRRIRRKFGLMRRALSSVNSYAAESFMGFRDIKAFHYNSHNQLWFKKLSHRLANRFLAAVKEYAYYNPLVPFMTSLMDIVILAYGSYLISRKELTVGELVIFLSYSTYFGWPIKELAEKLTIAQQAFSALERLSEIEDSLEENDQGSRSFEIADIEFEKVSFRYREEGPDVLKDISFKIARGSRAAIIGETGSGKSTICSLMMRAYQPQSGKITVGGKPLDAFSLNSLRAQVGWVSQDIQLFSATLRENIRLFDSRISDPEIWEALQLAHLDQWAMGLELGLDEILSDRGTGLSTGQRQLLSFARAIVRKPGLFILDEATSAIDQRTETLVQRTFERVLSKIDRTASLIIVAHRLSTVRRCDVIFVMKHGRIVDHGTYEEIRNSVGYGAELFRHFEGSLLRESM